PTEDPVVRRQYPFRYMKTVSSIFKAVITNVNSQPRTNQLVRSQRRAGQAQQIVCQIVGRVLPDCEQGLQSLLKIIAPLSTESHDAGDDPLDMLGRLNNLSRMQHF